ncbi:hypothetical protein [Candidatus Poriferisocius sp.]|uniref:hypothetical protein n=1 Tax=Candidatus Poriferisocius sp. TaxID=3101276 RepID=UPI003B51906F
MPVLLGALASGLIGVSDYFGRYCSRRAQAMTTVGTAFVGGLVTIALAVIFDDDTLRWWQAIGIAAVLAGTTMITIG